MRWPLLSSARGLSCVAAGTLRASLQRSVHIDDIRAITRLAIRPDDRGGGFLTDQIGECGFVPMFERVGFKISGVKLHDLQSASHECHFERTARGAKRPLFA